MQYLIDGHNLIPKVHGLSLSQIDDEEKLIAMLREFCRLTQASVDVYFDRAGSGKLETHHFGRVTAHFVPPSTTADDTIIRHIRKTGKSVRNWVLVTSDNRIQVEARACHMNILPSEEFAVILQSALDNPGYSPDEEDSLMTDIEIDAWLEIFRRGSRMGTHEKF